MTAVKEKGRPGGSGQTTGATNAVARSLPPAPRPVWSIWTTCPSGRGRRGCRCYIQDACPLRPGFADENAFRGVRS
jgi:hypothetical protein